jgi:hypothetical protein
VRPPPPPANKSSPQPQATSAFAVSLRSLPFAELSLIF